MVLLGRRQVASYSQLVVMHDADERWILEDGRVEFKMGVCRGTECKSEGDVGSRARGERTVVDGQTYEALEKESLMAMMTSTAQSERKWHQALSRLMPGVA
ncbi:hypothetical protein CPC08DRAFT_803269 [Agrocybe pediades]|nr:hypothetical protein CPC08DRAFT_803269 [Agrocybe pediades]